jgi:predicted house-cleaning noncanonical NTP pyrophosphatase (MazG superfamily)
MKYNKLIRDNIPEIIKDKGGIPITHIADDAEYWVKLKEKLQEEVGEFLRDENKKELADILEVLDAIITYKELTKEDVEDVKVQKVKERGAFTKRIILEES